MSDVLGQMECEHGSEESGGRMEGGIIVVWSKFVAYGYGNQTFHPNENDNEGLAPQADSSIDPGLRMAPLTGC